ncbi:MAG: histidine phosphatase family protein [Desulfovibrionaceae bacterium]
MRGMVLLLRHGRIPQVSPRRFVGQTDPPLDNVGRAQAEAVRRRLEDTPLARVVSSDLRRALDTAAIVCRGREMRIEPEPALREICLGAWEGLTVDEVRARFPGAYEARGQDMAHARPEGGESFADLDARAWPVFARVARTAHAAGATLVVAHAGVNRVLLCHALGMPLAHLFRLGQDYCCLNVIQPAHHGFVLHGLNQLQEESP